MSFIELLDQVLPSHPIPSSFSLLPSSFFISFLCPCFFPGVLPLNQATASEECCQILWLNLGGRRHFLQHLVPGNAIWKKKKILKFRCSLLHHYQLRPEGLKTLFLLL